MKKYLHSVIVESNGAHFQVSVQPDGRGLSIHDPDLESDAGYWISFKDIPEFVEVLKNMEKEWDR